MKLLAAAMLYAACLGNAHAQVRIQARAQNDVYVCTDENGAKEYRNTGATAGCRKVELPGVSGWPASPQPKRPGQGGGAAGSAAAASFPKVDTGAQKSRDGDRKLLLQDELKAEEKKLAGLKADFSNGEPERRGDERNYAKYQERVAGMKDDMARSERNIAALKRELANVR